MAAVNDGALALHEVELACSAALGSEASEGVVESALGEEHECVGKDEH